MISLILLLVFIIDSVRCDYGALPNGESLTFTATLPSDPSYIVVITSDSCSSLNDNQAVTASMGGQSIMNMDFDSTSSAVIIIPSQTAGSAILTITANTNQVSIGDVQLFTISGQQVTITASVTTTTAEPTTTTAEPTTTTAEPTTTTKAPTTTTTEAGISYPLSIAAGQSVSFSVTLPVAGWYYFKIQLNSNAGDNQYIIATMGGQSSTVSGSANEIITGYLAGQQIGSAIFKVEAYSYSNRVVISSINLYAWTTDAEIDLDGNTGSTPTTTTTTATPTPSLPTATPAPNNGNNGNGNGEQYVTIKGIEIDKKMQRYLLDKHNELRDRVALNGLSNQPKASYMNELHWDPALAAIAQKFTETCPSGHNNDRVSWFTQDFGPQYATFEYEADGMYIGENYLKYTLGFGDNADQSKYVQAAGFTEDGWFNEYEDYNYDSGSCSSVCGHYTQFVWADTRYIGCGASECGASNGYTKLTVVCNYYPAGNNGDQKPYPQGTPCSDCKNKAVDRNVCDARSSGLCYGCQSSYFGKCKDKYTNCASSLSKYCPSSSECQENPSNQYCAMCPGSCGTCTEEQLSPSPNCDNNDDGLDYSSAQAFIGLYDDQDDAKQVASWAVNVLCVVFALCICLLIIGYILHRRKVKHLQKQIHLIQPQNTNNEMVQKKVKLPDDEDIEVSYDPNDAVTRTAD